MFSLFCLLASSAILFYILKYRVHVHVHVAYTPTGSSARAKRSATVHDIQEPTQERLPRRRNVSREGLNNSAVALSESIVWGDQETTPILDKPSVVVSDIQSALVNLGANSKRAKVAALHAVREHPEADFNLQFSVALQEVRRAV